MIEIYVFQVREEPDTYSFQIHKRGNVVGQGKRVRTFESAVKIIISALKMVMENDDDGARLTFNPPDETLVRESEIVHCVSIAKSEWPRFLRTFRGAGLPLTGPK